MKRRMGAVAGLIVLVLTVAPSARATVPFPAVGGDVYDYTRLHLDPGKGVCANPKPADSQLPSSFDCVNSTKLTDYRPQPGDADYDPTVENNPQELFGVKGAGTNRAWEVTTGRPDTVIAVMDSGIEWKTRPALVNKVALNRGELPVPCTTSTGCAAAAAAPRGGTLVAFDVNHDGLFNAADYANDPRVPDINGNGVVDGQDLIHAFSDGVDHDSNGYVNDIAGWDFYQADNDPSDDVTYGHGSGEATDSAAEITNDQLTQCPNCLFLPMRVGDSFIADINHWAQAVVYAVDNGASVVQEALGTIDHTGFAQTAADYAYHHGVLIVASEADEEAGHHNWPAALNHTMVVNSVTQFVDVAQNPKTYLSFNGCTNFGGYTWVSVESNSCSSDATGQSSGMAGLLYSAARNAISKGTIGQRSDTGGRPLSAEEAKQLYRLAANDIDFSTPKGGTTPDGQPAAGPANNFATSLPDSQRYVTTANWDQITGWGRISSDALVHLVAGGKIPPEADIVGPAWWQTFPSTGRLVVNGRVAAPRASAYTYAVQFAPGVQPPRFPASDTWTTVTTGTGTAERSGPLAAIDLAQVKAAIAASPPVYTAADDPTSRDLPEQDAFRVRVVVCAAAAGTPCTGDYDVNQAIEQRQYFIHDDPDLRAGWPAYLNADGASSPAFDDLDGDNVDELIVGDGNGFVHAYRANGTEIPGFPVHTAPIGLPTTGSNAFTNGALTTAVFAPILLGSPTIADLNGDGWPEISVADVEGNLWAWDHSGALLAGFPVHGNPAFSQVPGCQLGTGPNCDEFSAHPVRDHVNTVDHAFTSNPTAGRIEG
ncbi:MAG: hypothetical protein QOG64_1183, partial [Acidimicrobiaceae bacterium]|nr:hypothetical protein [Acidimicrobiaceae bacterium]